ncbi:MAG TPA: YggS family pyridoxal phosphate-dependent enzyme [Xanthomonadales bacterium]
MNESIERLNLVRQRIEKACIAAGRQPGEVSLLAVSKLHSAKKIAALSKLGVLSFGENHLQEALQKQRELANLNLQWHFIGTLQSNKTRAIAENFQWVQSVDRQKTLKRLSDQRPANLEALNVCLQVNIDLEPQKAGAQPDEILQLAEFARGLSNIKLRGLMAIPRVTTDLSAQHESFRKVKILFEVLKRAGHDIDTLSMGMSSDLEIAIAEGSTMVRIGTDLFGKRES